MSCCLLQQKLQMLNCCIQHKLAHEQKLNTPHLQSHSQSQVKFPETDSHSTVNSSTVQPTDSYSTPEKLAQNLEKSSEFLTPASSLVFTQQEVDAGGGSPSRSPSGSEDEFYEALESQEQVSFSARDASTLDGRDSNFLEDGEMDIDSENVSGRADEELKGEQIRIESSEPLTLGLGENIDKAHSQPTEETHPQSTEETHSQFSGEIESRTKESQHEVVESHLPPDRHDGGVASERVGALQPCGDLVLIATGEPLYVPITQVRLPAG